ncbi:ImmA/IrrE family metallo-endopeptidase [Mesorhizobium comanense]|uniref:ImmA/IrrE family metallo-endopeptidase n=1 Tax=Mesorhizobium comanense TaxID=2502215 RepID=UPI001E4DE8DD|nr:ImmA/IrrE family metallo-endopeptidase [Mesorhizobium comanense]
MGIVKYDQSGLEVVADRSIRYCLEGRFVKSQIFQSERPVKSLKFSAFHDGKFFGTINHFFRSLQPGPALNVEVEDKSARVSVPYLSAEYIEKSAGEMLEKVGYELGSVDLQRICSILHIDLKFSEQVIENEEGKQVLGSANFDRKSIQINFHADKNRERFTLGHEIGHFCLKHDTYLRSETIVERDLFINTESEGIFDYERLEFQANYFSSNIILPNHVFCVAVNVARQKFDIRDRGHGYIFVDDQPCNFVPYNQLLQELSSYFGVSRRVVEIKLRTMGFLIDQRMSRQPSSTARLVKGTIRLGR